MTAEICFPPPKELRETSCAANAAVRKTKVCATSQFFRECGIYRLACLTLCLDTGSKTILTKSKPSDFPSFLRQKLQSSVQAVERHNVTTESTAFEKCPKCGREEVKYANVQLRSADEGSTIIYMCECGHSYVFSNNLALKQDFR